MSAIDSEVKSGRPAVVVSWAVLLWSASGLAGVVLLSAGLMNSQVGMAAVAGVLILVSALGLLDHYTFVNVRQSVQSTRPMTRSRIGAYYRKGQELYFRLEKDSPLAADEVRKFVADAWVNPTTEYLRGTLGESKAAYFLSVRPSKPDDAAVLQFGYERALARKRILIRLERLRRIAGEM